MKEFEIIDRNLSEQIKLVKEITEKLKFQEIRQFILDDEVKQNIPWNDFKYSGIYLIEIKNSRKFLNVTDWVRDFTKKWDLKDLNSSTPSLKKKRVILHKQLDEWIPNLHWKIKKHK